MVINSRDSSHRMTLSDGMFAIMLIAVNLAAASNLTWPALDFTPLHISLSFLPMFNVLTVLGYRLWRKPKARNPFAKGFLISGLIAVLAHVACVRLDLDPLKCTYLVPIGPFVSLCKTYQVPYWLGRSPEGWSYFRFYPALILINFLTPQLVVASLGGVGCVLATRARPMVPGLLRESSPVTGPVDTQPREIPCRPS